jgi:hypothetical protein
MLTATLETIAAAQSASALTTFTPRWIGICIPFAPFVNEQEYSSTPCHRTPAWDKLALPRFEGPDLTRVARQMARRHSPRRLREDVGAPASDHAVNRSSRQATCRNSPV